MVEEGSRIEVSRIKDDGTPAALNGEHGTVIHVDKVEEHGFSDKALTRDNPPADWILVQLDNGEQLHMSDGGLWSVGHDGCTWFPASEIKEESTPQ